MSGHSAAVIVPFRNRSGDPLREENLACVEEEWYHGMGFAPQVFDDGRTGEEQFNRSAAYNRAVAANPQADVFVFIESDVLLPFDQVEEAIRMALEQPGLVIPFDTYRYLGPEASRKVRAGLVAPQDTPAEWVMRHGSSVGAANVVSRLTYEAVGGYDEQFEGSSFDDRAMHLAFDAVTYPARWVLGPLHHLYHLPAGGNAENLTDEDRAATARNKSRLDRYVRAKTTEDIWALTMEGRS